MFYVGAYIVAEIGRNMLRKEIASL